MKEVEEVREQMDKIVSAKNFGTGVHLLLAIVFGYTGVVMTYFIGKKLAEILPWKYIGYTIAGIFAFFVLVLFICYIGYIVNRLKE